MQPAIISSAESQVTLERFADPALLADGRVVLVSVAAIRERMDRRWPLRREGVWEFLERQFRKDSAPTDHLSRLNDDAFLLVLPSMASRFAAEVAAVNLLKQVLEFFLGRSGEADIHVSRVVSMDASGITHQPLTPEELSAVWRGLSASPEEPAAPTVGAPAWRALEPAERRLLCLTVPIWNIQRKAVVSHQLQPLSFELAGADGLLPSDVGQLRTRDIVEHDLEVLEAAFEVLRAGEAGRRFALHVPQRFEALASSHRWRVLSLLRAQALRAQACVVICIEGLDSGTPPGRLIEIASVLKPNCLGVVAHAASLETEVQRWAGAPLGAISVDLAQTASTAGGPSELARFTSRARQVCRTSIAHSATTTAALLTAWAAGFTHVSGDVLADRLPDGFLPRRFEPADLYERGAGVG